MSRHLILDSLVYKGYLFDTYIIMQSTDIAYLIDQHAAHERIMYERFITMYNDSEHVSQPMLMPFSIETSSDVYAAERFWMDDLARLGFDIDDLEIIHSSLEAFRPTWIEVRQSYLSTHTLRTQNQDLIEGIRPLSINLSCARAKPL